MWYYYMVYIGNGRLLGSWAAGEWEELMNSSRSGKSWIPTLATQY